MSHPEVRVGLVTGTAADVPPGELRARGIDAVVAKPVGFERSSRLSWPASIGRASALDPHDFESSGCPVPVKNSVYLSRVNLPDQLHR